MFSLHADGLPAGSGDTRFYPLPLRAAQSRRRHPCTATNDVNSGSFRLTPFHCKKLYCSLNSVLDVVASIPTIFKLKARP
ncbi:hypothetical protein TNCV_293831 [Trichonephila clavipes]|nr:hypothetical protein TNCV_293831 [Trichonephila clavipes]